jgi:hypothetical protein
MKVSSSQGTSGAGGAGSADQIQQDLDQLEQYMQSLQTQLTTGVQQMDPNQLSQGIQNNLSRLGSAAERGLLTQDQTSQVQQAVGKLGSLLQGQPQNSNTQPGTGYSMEDKYDGKTKVGGHHGGHHAKPTPPVDGTDPDSRGIRSSPTDS